MKARAIEGKTLSWYYEEKPQVGHVEEREVSLQVADFLESLQRQSYIQIWNVILWVSAFAEIPLIYHTINDYHLSNTYIHLIICTRSIDVLPEIQAVQPRRPSALVGTKDVNTHVHGPEFHRLYTTRVLTTIRSSRLLQPQIFN